MKEERSSFSGSIGFVLAAAGSAVGLGNLWRFPYLAAQYGGIFFIDIGNWYGKKDKGKCTSCVSDVS